MKKIKIQLSKFGEFRTSSIDKKSVAGEPDIKLLNYMDVYRNNKITKKISLQNITAKLSQIEACDLKRGDILFTPSSETADDIGHAGVVMEDLSNAVFSYHLIRYRANKEILDPEFSSFLFQSPKIRHQFYLSAQGLTRFTLSIKEFNDLIVEIPESLEEQKRIAQILTCVDKNIEITEQEINSFENLKLGFMKNIFRNESKDSDLKLENYIKLSSGEFLPKSQMVLTGKNLVYGGNGVNGKHSQYNKKEPSLIIGRVGAYCGNVHITNPFSWITDNALIVSFKSEQNINFWYYLLTYLNLNSFSYSGGHPVITAGIINEIEVKVPPVKEQNKIVTILMNIDDLIKNNKNKKQKLQQIKKGLLNKLL